ncbi:MAG: hypothetical protein IT179_17370 [Acidobacteria bacterium]|nr:hypothetical protein [Acidobacteriota bacterium]
MARCAAEGCGRWRPDLLVSRGVGARVDGRWFCSRACLEQMARERLTAGTPLAPGLRGVPPMRLGTLLAAKGVCDSASLSRALEAQRESGLRLGEQLQAMGAADRQTVLTALATQFGVRCLPTFDPTTVRHAPGGLCREAVRALRIAPISDPIEHRVRVASPAPIRRRALGALRRLTGWTLEVYLVTDEDWMAILAQYGAEPRPAARPLPALVCTSSVAEAAARIAAAAARGRDATVIEANWEDHAWIRVQAPGVMEDVCLVLPEGPPHPEEASWLAATTSR